MIKTSKTILGLSDSGKTTKCIEELLLIEEDSNVVVFSKDRDFSYVAEDEGYSRFLSNMNIWEPERWTQEELELAVNEAMFKGNRIHAIVMDDIEMTSELLIMIDNSIVDNIIMARSMNRNWEGLKRKQQWFKRY